MDTRFDLNAFIVAVTAHLEQAAAQSALTDFLLELMQHPDARAGFERDPHGVCSARGLDGATAQDVRNARSAMISSGGLRAHDDVPPPAGDDALGEMRHTVAHCTLLDRALAELLPLERFRSSDADQVMPPR